MTRSQEARHRFLQPKKKHQKTTMNLLAHCHLLQFKKKKYKNQKRTTSLPAHHHLLQPKKKNQKMMKSQEAHRHLLQPKKKNQKMMMSQEACHCLLQPKKKKLRNNDKSRGSLLSSTTQEKKQKNIENDDKPRGSLSYFVNIKHPIGSSSMPTHIQIRGWSFLLDPVQKQGVVGNKLKDRHYNKLPNSFLMDHILGMFSFLTSLPTSHFLDFLQEAFGICKLFVNESIINLFFCHYIIKFYTSCELGGMPP